MAASLIKHEQIVTTLAKAKDLKRVMDKYITLAKRGDLNSRRLAAARMRDEAMVKKLFDRARVRATRSRAGRLYARHEGRLPLRRRAHPLPSSSWSTATRAVKGVEDQRALREDEGRARQLLTARRAHAPSFPAGQKPSEAATGTRVPNRPPKAGACAPWTGCLSAPALRRFLSRALFSRRVRLRRGFAVRPIAIAGGFRLACHCWHSLPAAVGCGPPGSSVNRDRPSRRRPPATWKADRSTPRPGKRRGTPGMGREGWG